MDLKEYISTVNQKYRAGNATEHSYRGALEQLMQTLLPELLVTNEPKHITDCGAPDYVVSRKDTQPIFYIEAKDVNDNDLDGHNKNKPQFTRYKRALDHIIFTNYLDFHFYDNGEWVENISIGERHGDKIALCEDQIDKFISAIRKMAQSKVQPISSATKLAEIMAAKARLLRNSILGSLNEKEDSYDNQQLHQLYEAFKDALIKDLSNEKFADMYAQTIAYGLFAARLHDNTPENFTREEAVTLIPKSNPFLRQLFNSIAGIDLDERVAWIVDDLIQTFAATDVGKVMRQYGKNKRHNDPMIHFYEDFLKAYDSKLREKMGVYYTPQPVVTFIVRAVDEILRRDFQIAAGLADKQKIPVDVIKPQEYDNRTRDGYKHVEKLYHRVQILDPATGTGTFLAEVINTIYDEVSRKNAGIWQEYVSQHLLPRLNGFEILMASYAIAHLKLDMVLQNTGYVHNNDKRFNVFLTNSLEKGSYEKRNLFSLALSAEMEQASEVKNDKPVMVMIGNPPYSVSSSNKDPWIQELIADYKSNLKERKINLDDDFIKFIRLGQHYIHKNKTGILAYITNNVFLAGLTHRQMRLSLLKEFDDIYIIDLHGNLYEKDSKSNGGKDENVFDITKGVSINIFVKTGKKAKEELANVHFHERIESRDEKFAFLEGRGLEDVDWTDLPISAPNYFFSNKNFGKNSPYETFLRISELMPYHATGIVTGKDSVVFWNDKQDVISMINDLKSLSAEDFRLKYKTGLDTKYWNVDRAKNDIKDAEEHNKLRICPILFRPFDVRFFAYTGKSNGIVQRPIADNSKNMLHENIGLIIPRQTTQDWRHVFVSQFMIDGNLTSSARLLGAGQLFPLYIKKEDNSILPNFNEAIFTKIEESLGESVAPEELFDYIYAVLHSLSYRERYREFLKIDFPRVPYPVDKNCITIWQKKGQSSENYIF